MNKKFYLALVISGILLFPLLFFPFTGDQSIFALGGKMMFDGLNLYENYIDLKPPMVFIYYGLISLFAGTEEIFFRLFEYIWQLLTVIMIYRVVKSKLSEFEAISSVILYSAVYISMNYSQTLQPEGFINLFVILLIAIQFRESQNLWSYVFKGILIGIATSFKFTFGILLIIIFIDDYFKSKNLLSFSKTTLIIILSMGLAFSISFFPLLNSESFIGYKNVLEYLSFYSNYPPISISLIKESIVKLSVFFGDNYSILLLIFVSSGIFSIIRKEESNSNKLLILNALLLLLFSIATEKKFHEYHFLRMLVPLSIFAAIGFKIIFQNIKNHSHCNNYCKLLAIPLIALLLLLSPIPRLFNIAKIPAIAFSGKDKYDQLFEIEGSTQLLRVQYFQISNYIDKNFPENAKVVLVATGSNQINLLLYPKYQLSSFSQSCFYLGNGAPENWKSKFHDEFSTAEVLIIQNNDSNPLITGHNFTSLESIRNNQQLNQLLINNFVPIFNTKNFFIFEKK